MELVREKNSKKEHNMSENILEKINALKGVEVVRYINEQVAYNDLIFKTQYYDKKKLNGHFSIQDSILYCKEFLNFYVSGKNEDKISETWIGVVGSMRVPRSDDVYESLLCETTFSAKDDDESIKLTPPKNFTKIPELDFSEYHNKTYKVENKEISDWYNYLFEILDCAEKNHETADKAVHIAADYVGYLALCMMSAVKKCFYLEWNFVNKVTGDFNEFWRANSVIKLRTPPPHKKAAEKFSHEEILVDNMTLILGSYAFTDSPNKSVVQKIFEKSCLDNIEYWGMGCLYWLLKAQKPCRASAEEILNKLGSETFASLELRDVLLNFVKTNEITWRWSRLVCQKAFIGLSTRKDPALAATLAALANKCDMGKPIFKNVHFNKEIQMQAEKRAKKILKHIKSK